MESFPGISLVVPAYNQAEQLCERLEAARSYLQDAVSEHEIIVVDMGSRDGTAQAVDEILWDHPRARVIQQSRRWGVGTAVRAGALKATGRYILVSDAQFTVPIEEEAKLRGLLIAGADVAIGLRPKPERPAGAGAGWRRISLERSLSALPRRMGLTDLPDTQCPFKMFRHGAAQVIFSRNRIDGLASGVEVLLLARRARMDVAGVAVEWEPSGSVLRRPVVEPARMLLDLVRLRRAQRSAIQPFGQDSADVTTV